MSGSIPVESEIGLKKNLGIMGCVSYLIQVKHFFF